MSAVDLGGSNERLAALKNGEVAAAPQNPSPSQAAEPDSMFDDFSFPKPSGSSEPQDAETQMVGDDQSQDLLAESPPANPLLLSGSGGRVRAPLRSDVFAFPTDDPSTEAAVAAHLKTTRLQIAAARKQQQQVIQEKARRGGLR